MALRWCADYMGVAGEVYYRLNREYFQSSMSAKDVIDFTTAFMTGGISERDLYYNLKKGATIEDDLTFEEWQTVKQEQQLQLSVKPNVTN